LTAALAWAGEPVPAPEAIPSSDPVAVVAALIAAKPSELGQLEAIVGSLHRDTKVWAQAVGPLDRKDLSPAVLHARVVLDIDVFHLDPQKTEHPQLASYELDFPSGRDESLRLLQAAFGPPIALTRDGRRAMRYGPSFFALGAAGSDQLTLFWYAREPEFAIPHRTARETERLVADVAAIVRGGFTRRVIEGRLGPMTYDPSWGADRANGGTWELRFAPAGQAVPQEVQIRFKRPLPAAGLLPALGVKVPRVSSFDVHQQSRELIDLARPRPWVLEVEGYDLSIGISAKTLVKAKETFGPGSLWRGEPLEIDWIRASPPRR
jgi:hypothetical protein